MDFRKAVKLYFFGKLVDEEDKEVYETIKKFNAEALQKIENLYDEHWIEVQKLITKLEEDWKYQNE